MFFSKIKQGCWYTQLCNYRRLFVFKPVSNQLNIFVGYNLSFSKSLNAFCLEMDE